ncbi:hypothetical protein [Stutzerimonas chloritidismutans]|uniref:hypothetical protein n=1 Tax=Stutzerimonas chloritidismutans TaxID=203192 RepID=UPI0028AEFBBB|nr:hypothetical protein [Stutzerimonas chloritidismutans]
MINTGKCPKCEKILQNAHIEPIELKQGFNQATWNGAAISCPWCKTILSASIDPLAIKADIVNEIKKLLGR